MNVLHYAGIQENKSSGVSVIVPAIVNAQAEVMNVGLYNYGKSSFEISDKATNISNENGDDYHTFPAPFNKPDIVVFHSPFGITRCVKIAKMLRKDKIPYVIVPHGCFSKFALAKKRLKKWLAMNVIFRKTFRKASAIQFLSQGEKNASQLNEKGIVIPNGVALPSSVERSRHNGIKISYVGRKDLYPKGLDRLVGACSLIKNQLISNGVSVYIYGPYEKDNQNQIKALIADNGVEDVVFDCPPVYDENKEKVFLETDIIVLTSRSEGLPGVILEAWSYGCPALLSQESNIADEAVANNCGWKAVGDAQSVATALENILQNQDEIKEKSAAALAYVREKYSWSYIANQYMSEYKKIIEKV